MLAVESFLLVNCLYSLPSTNIEQRLSTHFDNHRKKSSAVVFPAVFEVFVRTKRTSRKCSTCRVRKIMWIHYV